MTDAIADREIVSSRLIAAPRELVFRAFIEPEHLRVWWGPKGFTNTFQNFEPRPGGIWRFVMHGPDGANYDNEIHFVEVRAPERIVLKHVSAPVFQMIMTMADEGGKTRLTWRQQFETVQVCMKLKPICVPANEQNFDRLEEELPRLS